jgi:hypothetical protein
MIKKTDLLWLLVYPLYQLVGTARHEGSHALLAWLQGAQLRQFVVLPSWVNGRLLWGYVQYDGQTTWLVTAAPYLIDLATYLICFSICLKRPFRRRWVWLNLVILGLISPLINSAYNYWGGLSSRNDVGNLLAELPDPVVHVYFIGTLLCYVIGLVIVFRTSATTRLSIQPRGAQS